MVRGTVDEALNAMLNAEADQLCGAGRYERSQARQDTRAGSYERALQTRAGEISLKFRSCEARPLRRRSSSAIAGAKVRLRKRTTASRRFVFTRSARLPWDQRWCADHAGMCEGGDEPVKANA
jgi:Transposase, Mutator family